MKSSVRFTFAEEAGNVQIDRPARATCDICRRTYRISDLEVTLFDFRICPKCILAGPSAVAAEAARKAGDLPGLGKAWGYKSGEDDEDIAALARAYHTLASALRPLRSFAEIPGGTMAVAVAAASRKSAAGRPGEAA